MTVKELEQLKHLLDEFSKLKFLDNKKVMTKIFDIFLEVDLYIHFIKNDKF